MLPDETQALQKLKDLLNYYQSENERQVKETLWYNLKDMWENFTIKEDWEIPPIESPLRFKPLSIDPVISKSEEEEEVKVDLGDSLEKDDEYWENSEINGYQL